MNLWRRHRATLLIVGAFVLAVVLVIWSTDGGQENDIRFDPANRGPDGAQAVARVLEDEGVDVHVARSADAFDDEEVGSGTTVVVTSTEQLGNSTLTGLLEQTGDARLVFVEPGPLVTGELGLSGFPETHGLGNGRDAACDDPLFDGLTMKVDQAIAYPGKGCFSDGGSAVVTEREGAVLFGAGEALTNDQVLRGGQRGRGAAPARPGRRPGLVRPDVRRPGRRRRDRPRPAAPALDRARAVADAGGGGVPRPVARPTPGAARHRAAPGGGQGDRDHAQPGSPLPPGRRPGPRRHGVALRRAAPGRRTTAPGRGALRGRAGPRRRPAHRPHRGRRRRTRRLPGS